MADNFKFAQLQPFTLYGAGATAGATSIVLKSMTDIDGNALTMAGAFGTKGFGTMEAGNGALEEQICFTGLVNNANGTVTLTGVSNVTFISPYTETSGLAKTHAGSTSFVISNTSGFYDELTSKNDDETIVGTWTFTSPQYPQMDTATPLPTLQAQFATKAYADSLVIAGAPNATTSVQGLVQLATQAQVDAKTVAGSTGASLVPTMAEYRSTLLSDGVVDTGVADAYVITPVPAISAYAAYQIFTFKAAHSNTTTSTLNVSALGVKTIKKNDGATNLQAGDIIAGQIVQVEYDGTNFQMVSPSALALPPISSGSVNEFLTTTNGTSYSFGRTFDYQAFTGSGTWTKPSNLSGNEIVIVDIWGGGGSGGGVASGGTTSAAGGGGGGAMVRFVVPAATLTSTVTVTIGAAITGTTGSGTAGNNSTFGSYVTAFGGGAGVGASSSGTANYAGGGGGGWFSKGADGSGTTNGTGGTPVAAAANTDSAGFGGGGAGAGNAVWGGGGGNAGNTAGTTGRSIYGGGGGGASTTNAGGTSVYGGAGGTGNSNGVGGAGVAPGGGGGGAANSTGTPTTYIGGGGARGECRVWTLY